MRKDKPAYRQWERFKSNRRGYYSLLLFLFFFVICLFAEVISNDKPFLVCYQGHYYFPILKYYPETTFGGDFTTEPDYRDPYMRQRISEHDNFAFFPLNPYSYDSINLATDQPVPSPPTRQNLMGTDDRGRDVLARLIYGFRLSVLFGLALTLIGTLIGIVAGALQGYFGG